MGTEGISGLYWHFGSLQLQWETESMFFKPGKEKEKLNSIDYDYHPTRFNHFLSLEKWSRWYFNKHIVPAQQNEISKEKLLKEMNSEAKRKKPIRE